MANQNDNDNELADFLNKKMANQKDKTEAVADILNGNVKAEDQEEGDSGSGFSGENKFFEPYKSFKEKAEIAEVYVSDGMINADNFEKQLVVLEEQYGITKQDFNRALTTHARKLSGPERNDWNQKIREFYKDGADELKEIDKSFRSRAFFEQELESIKVRVQDSYNEAIAGMNEEDIPESMKKQQIYALEQLDKVQTKYYDLKKEEQKSGDRTLVAEEFGKIYEQVRDGTYEEEMIRAYENSPDPNTPAPDFSKAVDKLARAEKDKQKPQTQKRYTGPSRSM